jgi:hypothetical protein
LLKHLFCNVAPTGLFIQYIFSFYYQYFATQWLITFSDKPLLAVHFQIFKSSNFQICISSHYIPHNLPRHIRQPVTPALETVRKPLMIQAHQRQYRCMKIMHVHRVFYDVVTKIIRFAVNARLYAAACHPDGKAAGVVVAAIIVFG